MIKILDNCCSPAYLDFLKLVAINSENWNLMYPPDKKLEDRFLKLNIQTTAGVHHPMLTGLAMGLLFQIHEAGGQGLFIPVIYWLGISIKDKHTKNNIHVDPIGEDKNVIKILGIINSDWEENWGGGFFHSGTSHYIKPTSFCIFDPTEPHANEEIFTDKKRVAIDFTVFRDPLSLDEDKQIFTKTNIEFQA